MASLIHFCLDPFSRRMRLALGEYGIGAEMIEEEPWAPSADIFSLNPAGTLPIYLEDSATVICGVEAIGEYLEETRGSRVSLMPGAAFERAEVRRLAGWFDTKFYAEISEPVLSEKVVRRFLDREAGGGAPDMGRVRQAMIRLRPHLDYISHLADQRTWLAGEELSLADLAAAAHISVIDYFGDVPWTDYPRAKSWYQRIKSRPSFRPLLADAVRGLAPSSIYADLDF
jgi:glutathione S-transferase